MIDDVGAAGLYQSYARGWHFVRPGHSRQVKLALKFVLPNNARQATLPRRHGYECPLCGPALTRRSILPTAALLRAGQWTLLLSNTVATEYEEILLREATVLGITPEETSSLLDDICILAERCRLSGSWQPLLSDPDDEAFAQLASEAKADYLVPHNLRHYEPIRQRGIRVVTPKAFLVSVQAGP